MDKRLKLLHLTAIGNGLPDASIEFGDNLTVIHGASDTGKSHIFDLLSYVFGLTKQLELPPEGKGYQYIALGILDDESVPFTLLRHFDGGDIQLFSGDIRSAPRLPAHQILKPNHASKDTSSVSRFLMSQVGLDDRYVRKNQNNETRMLEWRDIFHLFAVAEEKVLSKTSPIEFGQHTARPVEAAIFRLFLEGTDDSGLVAVPKKSELKKISANKVEVLDELISDLETRLGTAPPVDQLREQLSRLNSSLDKISSEIEVASSHRDSLLKEKLQVEREMTVITERLDEVASLIGRFSLLHAQYESDLNRLDLVEKASGFFDVLPDSDCAFCGAPSEHQHWAMVKSGDNENINFLPALESEKKKIKLLVRDLIETTDGLGTQQGELESARIFHIAELGALSEAIRTSDEALVNPAVNLGELLETRSRLEQQIQLREQFLQLTTVRGRVAAIEPLKTDAKVSIDTDDLNRFDQLAERILTEWAFPHDGPVYFSMEDRDIHVDRRSRRNRGKGVRSILHALFNVALAEYCMQRNLAHPGLVVLDSPVVTYRQPDEPDGEGEEETITTSVVDAFYGYMQNSFNGQSIILENKSPVSPLPSGSREYFFGGPGYDGGRKGFYPGAASPGGLRRS